MDAQNGVSSSGRVTEKTKRKEYKCVKCENQIKLKHGRRTLRRCGGQYKDSIRKYVNDGSDKSYSEAELQDQYLCNKCYHHFYEKVRPNLGNERNEQTDDRKGMFYIKI